MFPFCWEEIIKEKCRFPWDCASKRCDVNEFQIDKMNNLTLDFFSTLDSTFPFLLYPSWRTCLAFPVDLALFLPRLFLTEFLSRGASGVLFVFDNTFCADISDFFVLNNTHEFLPLLMMTMNHGHHHQAKKFMCTMMIDDNTYKNIWNSWICKRINIAIKESRVCMTYTLRSLLE